MVFRWGASALIDRSKAEPSPVPPHGGEAGGDARGARCVPATSFPCSQVPSRGTKRLLALPAAVLDLGWIYGGSLSTIPAAGAQLGAAQHCVPGGVEQPLMPSVILSKLHFSSCSSLPFIRL